MAITYVASGTPQYNASAALTVPWPTHQVGDLALLVVTMNVSGGFADPTYLGTANGFKPLTQFFYNQAVGNSTRIWWCLATSTSMASPITNINADALGTRAIIHTFRGVDQVVPCIAGAYGQTSLRPPLPTCQPIRRCGIGPDVSGPTSLLVQLTPPSPPPTPTPPTSRTAPSITTRPTTPRPRPYTPRTQSLEMKTTTPCPLH